jgi:hypothetical protein
MISDLECPVPQLSTQINKGNSYIFVRIWLKNQDRSRFTQSARQLRFPFAGPISSVFSTVVVIEDLPVMSVSRTVLCLRLLKMKVVLIAFN